MKCSVCDHDEFTSSSETHVDSVKLVKRTKDLSRAKVRVELIFTCERCSTSFTGFWEKKIAVLVTKEPRQPFSREVICKTRIDFGEGWDLRHKGVRLCDTRLTTAAHQYGWTEAHVWSEKHHNRPPVEGEWKNLIGDWLITKQAWEYMKSLRSIENWSKSVLSSNISNKESED